MRAVRRLLVLIVFAALAPAAPAQALVFAAGTGQNPGVAMDGLGTAYVGWQIDTYGPNDAVQVCRLPAKAKQCESVATVAFPGQGFNRSRVSLVAWTPDVVDAIIAREIRADYSTYLARSVDGGRTFGPARQISETYFEQAVPGPNGTLALVGGIALHAGVVSPDGSGAATEGSDLSDVLAGQFNDITGAGGDVVAAGSDAAETVSWRLPAGADPNFPANWLRLADLPGERQPELASDAHGTVGLFEPVGEANGLHARRLVGNAWGKPVRVTSDDLNNDFALVTGGAGRLSALRTDSGFLYYATSKDGGTLWSSEVEATRLGGTPWELEAAAGADGRGVAAVRRDKDILVTRFAPSQAPIASRRIKRGRVQVRTLCDGDVTVLVVEAKRDGVRVSPSKLLRRASFARARGAARLSRSRFRARYDLTRSRTRVKVRFVPRSGRSKAVRLAVRRCG